MKPVAIFRHARTEGPGYFAAFLEARGVPWRLIAIDRGDALPDTAKEFAGLVFMGGPMSVNDDLPWIPPALHLIREAVSADIPVLGHCLGGQLMAKALGGEVESNPVKEIGWGELSVASHAEARRWFGTLRSFLGFHWHGETFSIPSGATPLLSSRYCAHQAFALGKHLGFQCHIEMTSEMVRDWCMVGTDEVAASRDSPGVQEVADMTCDLEARVRALNEVAASVYTEWVKGLVP